MKIVIFRQYFKLPNQAGSSRLYKFAKALGQKGHSITIVTGPDCRAGAQALKYPYKRTNFLYHEFYISDKIHVISIFDFYKQRLSFHMRIASFISFTFLSILVPFIKKMPADLYLASSTPLTIAIPGILFSKIYQKPFIFEVRDLWPEGPIQMGILKNKFLIRLAKDLEKYAYQSADSIIGLARGVCKQIQNQCHVPVLFIPNPVDEEFFNPTERDVNRNKENKNVQVVYAGSCGYNNAIEIFFKVAERLWQDKELSSFVTFTLVGDGPALQSLKKNVPPNLKLLGKQPKNKTIGILKKSDIALFSQRKVSGGDFKKNVVENKYFDFLGARLPIVIGSISGGEMANEISENGCGIVVQPENVEDLYLAVRNLSFDPLLREDMAKSAGKLAEKYHCSILAERFCSFVEKTFLVHSLPES